MYTAKLLRLLATILLTTVVTFAVAACGQQGSGSESDDGGQQKKLTQIEIAVTHYPVVLHAVPYEVAQEKGFFKEEGIEVKRILPGEGGGTTVRNVLAGDLAFGDVSAAAGIQSYLSGAPVQIVSGTVNSVADFYYATRKDAPYEDAQDLIGKKWAFTNPGSITQTALLVVLEELGIEANSVELVAAGGLGEGLTLLKEGGVDAAPLLEPTYSAEKDQWKTLFHFSDYVSKYQGTALISSPQLVEENPELVKGFINAYQKSIDWIYENPEETGKIFAKYAEIEEEPAVSAVNVAVENEFWDTALEPEAVNNAVKGMRLAGVLEEGEEINWDELLNQSALPEDKRVDTSTLDTNK